MVEVILSFKKFNTVTCIFHQKALVKTKFFVCWDRAFSEGSTVVSKFVFARLLKVYSSGVISKRYSLTPLSKFFRRGKKQNLGNLDTKTHNSVMD